MKPETAPATVPFDEIKRIVRLMKDNDLREFQFERDGFRIKLRRGMDPVGMVPGGFYPAPVAGPHNQATASTAAPAAPVSPDLEISSPMVGTFYRAASPGASPFVNVGDPVAEGQTVCIIEAMKVMNEIKAEKAGTLVEVVAEDGKPVQFGETLFRLK